MESEQPSLHVPASWGDRARGGPTGHSCCFRPPRLVLALGLTLFVFLLRRNSCPGSHPKVWLMERGFLQQDGSGHTG